MLGIHFVVSKFNQIIPWWFWKNWWIPFGPQYYKLPETLLSNYQSFESHTKFEIPDPSYYFFKFISSFTIPWILRWEYGRSQTINPACLTRISDIKWWDKFDISSFLNKFHHSSSQAYLIIQPYTANPQPKKQAVFNTILPKSFKEAVHGESSSPTALINTQQHKDLLQEIQRMKDEIQFLKDPTIKKYGGFMQEASSFNGSINN